MMKKLGLLLVILLSFSWIDPSGICFAQNREKLKTIGEVVGYDRFASLMNITSAPQSQMVIVRTMKKIKDSQIQSYIIVVYKSSAVKSLPKEMFDGKSRWKFWLTRDENCDSRWIDIKSLKNTEGNQNLKDNSRFEWTSSKQNIADEIKLPCYILADGAYKKLE
jgi:hypothetical protein